MEIITTDDIQEKITYESGSVVALKQSGCVPFGCSEIGIGEQTIYLSSGHKTQIELMSRLCMSSFWLTEQTLVVQKFSLPTLVARVDCTLTPAGVEVFECEERPAGMGVTDKLMGMVDGIGVSEKVREHFASNVSDVPTVLKHPNTKPNDDALIFDVVNLDDDRVIPRGPLIFRAEPDDAAQHPQLGCITDRSVSTVLSKGDKSHTLSIPDLKVITATEEAVPDSASSFALKPVKGSKARGVNLYLCPEDRRVHGKHGTVTYNRAVRVVEEAAPGNLLIEAFKPPISVTMPNGKTGNMILRIFALIHPDGDSEVIGGTYVARQEVLVHGATNAINGPVIIA